jgi:8-oxo-dGTP pyrophosphatase MutT (NUDIX family)
MTMVSSPLSFDPRNVPVWRIDHDMPAVPSAHLLPEALKARFAQPPAWQPEVVKETSFSTREPAHAAVLVPLVLRGPDFSQSTVLLTERAKHLSTHSGQIAFPGGKVDPQDSNRADTALREAHEEIGLDPKFVQVIGQLPVYVTGTAFWVTPIVALVSPELELIPNADEVQDVFEVPLDFLMNPAHHRRHTFEWQGTQRQWFSMPYHQARITADGQSDPIERFIWGATAAMLRNFYRFLSVNPT